MLDNLQEYINERDTALSEYLKIKDRSPSELYKATAGEIEAQDTANRASFTAEERKNTRPDIDRMDVAFANATNISLDYMDDKPLSEIVKEIIEMSEDEAKKRKANGQYIKISQNTPSVVLQNVRGAKNLPVIMRFDAVYLATRSNGVLQGHYHRLNTDFSKRILSILSLPDAIVRLDNGRINLFGSVKLTNGVTSVVSVELETAKDINSKNSYYNLVVTMFEDKPNYVRSTIKKHVVLTEYKKENLSQVNPQLYEWLSTVNEKFSNDPTVTQKSPSVNSILSENPKKITTVTKNTAENSGVKRQASIANGTYDYTKSFEEQLDDWIKGKVPQRDSLLIGGTLKVMQEIGMNALPVTINQKHIDYAIKGTKDADHTIGAALIKQLPTALKNPVAIVSSNTMTNRVVALLNLRHNGKNVIAPVEIDGFGHTNNVRIDSNAVTSIFGKGNAVTTLLYNAAQKEANGRKDIFFWNKKEAVSLLQGAGLQLPRGLPKDGFIHSIRENGTNINTKFENVTQSLQFKRWFGDWQNHPETIAPELLNADGTPKVFYHGAKKNGGFR